MWSKEEAAEGSAPGVLRLDGALHRSRKTVERIPSFAMSSFAESTVSTRHFLDDDILSSSTPHRRKSMEGSVKPEHSRLITTGIDGLGTTHTEPLRCDSAGH